MKKLCCLMLLFVTSAHAGDFTQYAAYAIANGTTQDYKTLTRSIWFSRDGHGVESVTWLVGDVAQPSQEQVGAITNAAEVVAAYESAYLLTIAPTEFSHGIAIPDSASTNPVWEVGIDGGSLVTWISHASPYDAAAAESNRVAALSERSTLRHDLRVLKGVAQTNKAQARAVEVSNTSSTAQVRSAVIDLRRELIDANDTIIDLTRLVRQLLKEQNP